MQVRLITPADIPALLPMVQALAAHHGDAPMADATSLARDLFGAPQWAQGLLAEEEGTIGYALLLPLMRAHLGQRGMDIHHLFVAERARGRGIGTLLLNAARAHAVTLGCSYLTVSTQEQNAEARDFYVQNGFFTAPPSPWRLAMDLSRG